MTLNIEKKDSKLKVEKDIYKKMSWCIKNGIKIYFAPIDYRRGNIVVDDNGKIKVSEEEYNQTKLKARDVRYHTVVYKLYNQIYDEKNDK